MTQPTTRSEALFDRARAVTPGGVNSPVRAFNSVGGTPAYITAARGPYLQDVDGREYVDLLGSWGPALVGHAHPVVLEAVHAAVEKGLGFGTSTRAETELAELVVDRIGAIEEIRMVSTGTEATMTAIRLARGATGSLRSTESVAMTRMLVSIPVPDRRRVRPDHISWVLRAKSEIR